MRTIWYVVPVNLFTLHGDSRVSKPDLNITSSRARSARARVYQALYFDSTPMFTVCIHGLGTTVNISSSLCKHPERLSEFAFFSR